MGQLPKALGIRLRYQKLQIVMFLHVPALDRYMQGEYCLSRKAGFRAGVASEAYSRPSNPKWECVTLSIR